MKTHLFKRGIAGLLSLVMCLSAFIGLGTTTAFAAGEQAEVYLISFPRSGDANLDYSGTWGHPNLHYMNGWYSGESKYTTIRAMHSYDGNICYCIEPGTPQDTGDSYTSKDETFWDNLPSDFNSTISPYDMKLFIGRIMQYGYTGPISTSWRSQNPADAATLAEAMATQVLIWETVVGERDEDFNHISPGSYDAVKSVVSTAHPLYSQFISYYNSIEASVQRHSAIPSFMAKTPGKAQSFELAWNGTNYTATLTDSNNVLSDYSFSANEDGISFSVSGNKLVITAATAPSDSVRITASKSGSTRRGIITWTDGRYAPGSGIQDVVSYAQEVNDPVQAFLNLKVSYGSAKIVKTSEDGKVDNLTFTVTGNGVDQTVKTNAKGEIQIDNLMPGVYTVTEMDYDKYEPQESRRVTVVSGQVSTVTFNNKLKRGDLQINQADITSMIGTESTPFVTAILQTISLDELLGQWQNELDLFTAAQEQEVSDWIANEESGFTTWFDQMKADLQSEQAALDQWVASEQTDFLAWYNQMKDQLSEDAAGNLQLAISKEEIKRILLVGFEDGTKAFSDDGTVITSTASDGRTLTKTFTNGFLTMTNVLKSATGSEVARAVKTFDSDGKLISTVVTYS